MTGEPRYCKVLEFQGYRPHGEVLPVTPLSEHRQTAMEFSENVTVLARDGKTYYIVGTAHISRESVDEVREVIQKVRPDTVCVELCESRYQALVDKDRWKKLDIFKIIKEGKTLFLMANLALGAYQRRLGAKLGVKPGAELVAAIDEAETVGADLRLVDRDIRVTLKRAWRNVSFWKKIWLLGTIFESLVSNEEIQEEDLEELKKMANLSEVMREFAETLPEVKVPLIDERDRYLISSIQEAPGNTIVAVVGAGHVPGIVENFGKTIDRGPISTVPPPRPWVKALKWVIPAVVVAAFTWGYVRNDWSDFQRMLYAWILPNSIMAALLTAVAGGKPLTILSAFVGSPITSLNPLINTGMVAGLVEAWRRKPTVEDAERINEDVHSLRGFYRNAFTRVLLVTVAATMGSALGAWIGATWVVTLLG